MTDDSLGWLREQLSPEDLDRRIKSLDAQIRSLVRARDALRVARNALAMAEQAAQMAAGKIPEPEVYANGNTPGTREAIRTVFAEAPGHTLSVSEVVEALSERGWLPEGENPRKLVGASISSLVHRSGELERTDRRATYRLVKRKSGPTKADGPQETVSNRLFTGSADGEAASEAS